jgi:nucleoside-diphosphate kinase
MAGMRKEEFEQTLVLIKPDALKNSLTGYVLSHLSEFHTNLHFAAVKIVQVNRMLADQHYAEHRGKPFFPALLDYIMGLAHYPDDAWKRRVIAFVYQGPGAISKIRDIAGPTNPNEAREKKPGSIRALGTLVTLKDKEGKVIGQRMDNLIHASSTENDAEREIKLWFKPTDIPPLMNAYSTVVNEEHYYYNSDGKLTLKHERGSICLLAPGDCVWESDLKALEALSKGLPASCSLEAVAAKYLINEKRDMPEE